MRVMDAKTMCRKGYFLLPNREYPSPRSLLVSKYPLFKEEKESARRTARCHLTSEKSSKNYIRCENEPSQAAIQGFLPHLLATRVAGAVFTRQIYSRDGGRRAG
jgi:hypothetical protein